MTLVIECVGQQLSGGRNPRGVREYQVTGTDDAGVAYSALCAAAPIVWKGLFREVPGVEEEGDGVWSATVQYGVLEPREVGETTWSFDISCETIHITHALEHIQSYAASGTAPDHKGAIGVRKDGSGLTIEGCDIKVPIFSWEETHFIRASYITPSYVVLLESTVAHCNDKAFRIWGKGELLLLGVSAGKQAEQNVPFTLRFASSRTKTSFTIGDVAGVTKEGHHYLWHEFEPTEDATANALTNRLKAVHVERVYDYADFPALGLSDPWG